MNATQAGLGAHGREPGTTLLVGGDVRSMVPGAPAADALAFAFEGDGDPGRILAVGPEAAVRAAVPGSVREIDLAGRTVLPGFIDAHHHAGIGVLYGRKLPLVAPLVHDIPSLLGALQTAARELPEDRWLIATGWRETALRERRAPTRSELDDAAGGRPVFAMHYSFHRGVANSAALQRAGLDRHTPDPLGGALGRDRRGELDGLVIERALGLVESLARADALARDTPELIDRLADHHRSAAALGLTRLADAAVPLDLLALYRAADARGALLLPMTLLPVSLQGWLSDPEDVLRSPPTDPGGKLTIGPLKLVFDGAPSCAMCLSVWQTAASGFRSVARALARGSLDPLRTSLSISPRWQRGAVRSGLLLYPGALASDVVRRALDRGLSVATHAIGNAAISSALDAYAAAGSRLHAHGIPRIEHLEFPAAEDVARLAGLGVAVVTQPDFLRLPEIAHAPPIPGLPLFPYRALLDAGVALVGSSDYPVTTFDPLDGIRSAVFRRNALGETMGEEHRLTLDEALAMYTRSAAEVLGQAAECGTLQPGRRADLVILDRRLDERSLQDARVAATYVAGELLHGSVP